MGDTQADRQSDAETYSGMTRPGGVNDGGYKFGFYGCVQNVGPIKNGAQELTISILGTNSVIRVAVPDVGLTMKDGGCRYFPGRQLAFTMNLWPSDDPADQLVGEPQPVPAETQPEDKHHYCLQLICDNWTLPPLHFDATKGDARRVLDVLFERQGETMGCLWLAQESDPDAFPLGCEVVRIGEDKAFYLKALENGDIEVSAHDQPGPMGVPLSRALFDRLNSDAELRERLGWK